MYYFLQHKKNQKMDLYTTASKGQIRLIWIFKGQMATLD